MLSRSRRKFIFCPLVPINHFFLCDSSIVDIQWPEESLSWEAHDLINKLLNREPSQRPSPAELKAHPFFRGVDWDNIRSQEAPFIPAPNDNMDTSYFDGNLIMCDLPLREKKTIS